MFLHSRFLDWQETALRPLVYIFLHRPATLPQQEQQEQQRHLLGHVNDAVKVASEAIHIGLQHHRHGGTWLVARRVFSSAMLILALVIRLGHLEVLPDWTGVVDEALTVLKKWSNEAPDLALMADVLQRVLLSTQQHLGHEPHY